MKRSKQSTWHSAYLNILIAIKLEFQWKCFNQSFLSRFCDQLANILILFIELFLLNCAMFVRQITSDFTFFGDATFSKLIFIHAMKAKSFIEVYRFDDVWWNVLKCQSAWAQLASTFCISWIWLYKLHRFMEKKWRKLSSTLYTWRLILNFNWILKLTRKLFHFFQFEIKHITL